MGFDLFTDPPIIVQRLHIQIGPGAGWNPDIYPIIGKFREKKKIKTIPYSPVEVNRRSAFMVKCIDAHRNVRKVNKLQSVESEQFRRPDVVNETLHNSTYLTI